MVPQLEELRKEGEAGQRKINQYTRYGTIVLAIVQSTGHRAYSRAQRLGSGLVLEPGLGLPMTAMITLTTGTAFIMWLGEQITERGLGNGISMIIFAGIVAGLPGIGGLFELVRTGAMSTPVSLLLVAVVVAGHHRGVVFVERAQRRIPIHYAKRMVGNKMYGGQSSHLPLKVNMAGVIPPIFALALLLPGHAAAVRYRRRSCLAEGPVSALSPGQPIYVTVYVGDDHLLLLLLHGRSFQPVEVADNLKKQNAFIPGIRPGKPTADYIDRMLDAHHAGRRGVRRRRLHGARVPAPQVPRAVLLRRHLDDDRGWRHDGLHGQVQNYLIF